MRKRYILCRVGRRGGTYHNIRAVTVTYADFTFDGCDNFK